MAHALEMASSNAAFDLTLPEDFESPEGLSAVVVFDDFKSASEAGLAILAMGTPYWTFLHEGQYVICVSDQVAPSAVRELSEIALLKAKQVQAAPIELPEHPVSYRSFLVYALVLIGVFIWQSQRPILGFGRLDAELIMVEHEWWRIVTALTLHADLVHLVSNLVGGLGFAFLLSRFFGASSAWTLILLSGITGNWMNAALHHPEPHFSIGASTAVFGALGMLTGVGIWYAVIDLSVQRKWQLPQWLLPAFGGFTLLSLLGAGQGPVDVGAHLSGFCCGLVFGVLGVVAQKYGVGFRQAQFVLAGLPLVLIGGAWLAALYG